MQKRAWEIVAIILAITLTAVAIFVLVNRNRSTSRLAPESGAPRAENLINAGKYPEAVRIIDEIIKREPQNDYAWLLRYRATEPEGFIESARVSLDKAHQLNPRNPEYL